MRTAVFTIASNNYFGFVKTLMQSLEKSNPDFERYVGVADIITEEIRGEAGSFSLLDLKDMGLPDMKKMLFRYHVLELNTAIKPFVFITLFEKMGYDRVIYFDPDIFVYRRLTELEDIFQQGHEIVLTPHLTSRYDEGDGTPNDLDIMKSGVYNLGFLALSKSENTLSMLHWWGDKLEYQCVASFKDGLFVDQKWMDLVPGMYDHVYILKHAGYNTAYWNLTHRRFHKDDKGDISFNGDQLAFFHFSGLNPKDISNVSKYQNRFNIENIGELKSLFEQYANTVLHNGYDRFRQFKYSYNYFENGHMICDLLRKAYRSDGNLQKQCGENPFVAEKIFYKNRIRILAEMIHAIWYDCEDIRMIYPTVNSEQYVTWFLRDGYTEYHIAPDFVRGVSAGELLRAESWIVTKDQGKYRAKRFVKRHVSDQVWSQCRKSLKNIWKK